MSIFLRWFGTVISHWISLLGGSAVSVALLVWGQLAEQGSGKIPNRVWWIGIVVGFVLAGFLSWRKEWTTATALAVQRPAFSHHFAGLEQWEKQDGTLIDGKFNIKFAYENKSGIPVDDLTRRVVVIVDFDKPPVDDSGYSTNANRVFGPTSVRAPVDIRPLLPTHYFVLDLSYKDSRNGANYQQRMFYKWIGSRAQDFDLHFRDCTVEDRRLIETYLETRVTPSMTRI